MCCLQSDRVAGSGQLSTQRLVCWTFGLRIWVSCSRFCLSTRCISVCPKSCIIFGWIKCCSFVLCVFFLLPDVSAATLIIAVGLFATSIIIFVFHQIPVLGVNSAVYELYSSPELYLSITRSCPCLVSSLHTMETKKKCRKTYLQRIR